MLSSRPRNWGDNLTLVGAIQIDQWLSLGTHWGAMTTGRFVTWVRRHLVRHLRPGDIVVMDNLAAHKARQVRELIEAAWALIEIRIRTVAPRTGRTLRVAAQLGCSVVRPRHCRNWFAHAGYQFN